MSHTHISRIHSQHSYGLNRNNTQNDALLHRLVHTQLLSGVANPELNLTPAQRKKALAGRIQELAGHSKLGKGEKSVRAKEHSRASKQIRDGMAEKQAERRGKQLAEVRVSFLTPSLPIILVFMAFARLRIRATIIPQSRSYSMTHPNPLRRRNERRG